MASLLICLRHAEQQTPVWDPAAGDAAPAPDPPLTGQGCRQAEAVARALQTTGRFHEVFVSETARSRQTGEIIASHLAVDIQEVPDLAEAGMGAGPWKPGQRADVIERWIVGRDLDARLPGGETGHQVRMRMERALRDIASTCREAPGVVVGHVASLTVGVGSLCSNGPALWGRPLRHATPFPLTHGDEGWQVDWPDP